MNYIKSGLLLILTFLLCFAALFFVFESSNFNYTQTHSGFIDMNKIDNLKTDCVSIGGEFVQVNSDINNMSQYSIDIALPLNKEDIYLRLPNIFLNYILYIDGQVVSSRTGNPDNLEYPSPQIITIHVDNTLIHLDLYLPTDNKLLNSPLVNPLLIYDFYIGYAANVQSYQDTSILILFAIILFFFFFGISKILEFNFTLKDKYNIFIGIISITLGFEILLTSQSVIHFFFPTLSTALGLKLLCISIAVRNSCILHFIWITYNIKKMRFPMAVLYTLCDGIALISMLYPVELLLSSVRILHLLGIISVLTMFAFVTFFYSKRELSEGVFLMCSFLYLFVGLTLYYLLLIGKSSSVTLLPVFFLIFIYYINAWSRNNFKNLMKNITVLSENLRKSIFEMQQNKSTYISSHLRPEVIYNTLDSIAQNVEKDQEKVDVLIQDLAIYLRQTLDFTGAKTAINISEMSPEELNEYFQEYTIQDELAFCNAYISIVSEIYPSIKITFEYDDEVLNTPIPKYSIQTIIENSILHAFGGALHPTIKVSIIHYKKEIEVSITDNGKGMTPAEIRHHLENPGFNSVIGLYHINQILKESFNSEILIESTVNKYTTVSFALPERD